jgi:hypothetical protein
MTIYDPKLDDPSIKHSAALIEIWPTILRAAKKNTAICNGATYQSASGIPRNYTQRQGREAGVALDTLAEVAWILSGHRFTPHYWQMRATQEASKEGEKA